MSFSRRSPVLVLFSLSLLVLAQAPALTAETKKTNLLGESGKDSLGKMPASGARELVELLGVMDPIRAGLIQLWNDATKDSPPPDGKTIEEFRQTVAPHLEDFNQTVATVYEKAFTADEIQKQ